MEGNIIDLVWELTIPADAPTQLLDLRTMSSVVRLYCGECKVRLGQRKRTCVHNSA